MVDRVVSFPPHDDDSVSAEDVPVLAKDNGDGTYSLDMSSAQAVTIIQQNNTIIANQQAIIGLLQGGIGVNIISGGGIL